METKFGGDVDCPGRTCALNLCRRTTGVGVASGRVLHFARQKGMGSERLSAVDPKGYTPLAEQRMRAEAAIVLVGQ
jgi:hypothetical protein